MYQGNLLVSLLPLEFLFLFNVAVPNSLCIGGGFTIMSVVLSFRYILYPIVYVNSNYCVDNTLFLKAIILMFIEMIAIFATIYVYYKRNPIVSINRISPNKKVNSTIPIILGVIFLLFLLSGSDVIGKKHFIFNVAEAEDMLADEYKINNVLEKVILWGQLFITIFLVDFFYRKYQKWGGTRYYFCIFVVLFANCIYFSGNSRLSLLIPTMTVVAMLYKIFRSKAKNAIVLTLSVIGIVLVMMSIVKFYGVNSLTSESSNDLFSEFYLNAYFGGINNVIYGLKTYERYGTDMSVFFIDATKGVMGVSKYFANDLGTPNYFNFVIHGLTAKDQIIPTVTQGLLYFGYFFFWIPSVIMTCFVCFADRKWATTDDLQTSYCWAYVTIIVGWAIPGNLCHFFINFTNNLIPLLILIKINKLFDNNKLICK